MLAVRKKSNIKAVMFISAFWSWHSRSDEQKSLNLTKKRIETFDKIYIWTSPFSVSLIFYGVFWNEWINCPSVRLVSLLNELTYSSRLFDTFTAWFVKERHEFSISINYNTNSCWVIFMLAVIKQSNNKAVTNRAAECVTNSFWVISMLSLTELSNI